MTLDHVVKSGCSEALSLSYLSVSTRAEIGQFSGPYSTIHSAKITTVTILIMVP